MRFTVPVLLSVADGPVPGCPDPDDARLGRRDAPHVPFCTGGAR